MLKFSSTSLLDTAETFQRCILWQGSDRMQLVPYKPGSFALSFTNGTQSQTLLRHRERDAELNTCRRVICRTPSVSRPWVTVASISRDFFGICRNFLDRSTD